MNEESLFVAALEKQTVSERKEFLDEVCAGDVALRQRVERLLAAHHETLGILDQPARASRWTEVTAGSDLGGVPAGERVGTVIAGRYTLLERIGAGGMGTVWKAEQTQPVRRMVALKLIKAGMDSRTVLSRFEAERQALALMEHSNIARVLDGGTTESGRPFLVNVWKRTVRVVTRRQTDWRAMSSVFWRTNRWKRVRPRPAIASASLSGGTGVPCWRPRSSFSCWLEALPARPGA